MNAVGIFMAHPWLALVVAAGLWALWSWRHRHLAGLAAIGWLIYGVYEYLMFARVLCSGECNIRVDLLAIYPALLALSAAAVVHSLKSGSAFSQRGRPRRRLAPAYGPPELITMKWIAPVAFLLIAVAACVSVIFVNALEPTTAGAFLFFAVWLVLPYAVITGVLTSLWRRGAASIPWYLVTVLVSIGGILFATDVIFWHPDAQGAIAVLITPVLQGGAFAVLIVIALRVSRSACA